MLRTLALLLLVSVCGCRALSTVQTLAGDQDYTTLVSLVTQAGLVDTLNRGVYTILAPNNAAFEALAPGVLQTIQSDAALLKSVLLYHVIANRTMTSSMTNELKLTSMQGEPVRFNRFGHNNAITAQGCQLIAFDRTADNGVIQKLFRVMLPPEGDLVSVIAAYNETSILLGLALQAGLAAAIQGDGLTVFAPTDAAFNKLPAATMDRLRHDTTLLNELVRYHIMPRTVFSSGMYHGERLNTLDGTETLTVHFGNEIRINANALVIRLDVGGTNGVVHFIDTVLVPPRHADIVGRRR